MTENTPTAAALAAAQAIHKLINESPSTPTVQAIALAIDVATRDQVGREIEEIEAAEVATKRVSIRGRDTLELLNEAKAEIEAIALKLPANPGIIEFVVRGAKLMKRREVRPGVWEMWDPETGVGYKIEQDEHSIRFTEISAAEFYADPFADIPLITKQWTPAEVAELRKRSLLKKEPLERFESARAIINRHMNGWRD